MPQFPFPQAPEVGEIKEVFEQLHAYYSRYHADCDEMERLYELDFTVDVPDGYEVTIPGTARAIVDEATDHVITENPRIICPVQRNSDSAQRRSGLKQAFLRGMWGHFLETSDLDPLREFTKNLFLFGKAAYKLLPNPDWEEDPDAFPVTLRVITPRNLLDDPRPSQKRFVLEVYRKSAMEVAAIYADWLNRKGRRMDEPVEVIEYWDARWHAVLADDQMAFGPVEHGLPELPYDVRYAGFGRESYDGRPEKKARGILYGAKSLLRAEARRLTQYDALVANLAWTILFVQNATPSEVDIDYTPGAINYLPPNVAIDDFVPQLPDAAILNTLVAIQNSIQRVTFPSVVRGERPPGVTSAAQLAVLSGQARLRFTSVTRATQMAMQAVNRKMLRYVKEYFERPVAIWQVDEDGAEALRLRPQDIDTFENRVELRPNAPEEEDRRAALGLQLYSAGIIDIFEAMTRAGVENPRQMFARILVTRLLLSEEVGQALARDVTAEWGIDTQELVFEDFMRQLADQRRRQAAVAQTMGQVPGVPPQATGGRPITGGVPGSPEELATALQGLTRIPGGE